MSSITKRWLRDTERRLLGQVVLTESERTILALIRRIRRMERVERKLKLTNWALSALVKTLDAEKGKS